MKIHAKNLFSITSIASIASFLGMVMGWGLLSVAHGETPSAFGMISDRCTIQNWDTPAMQAALNQIPQHQRFALYGGIRLSDSEKRCLIDKKPFPVTACQKLIDQFELDAEALDLQQALTACPSTPTPETGWSSWLPTDLKPNKATLQIWERAKAGHLTDLRQMLDMSRTGDGVPASPDREAYWLEKLAQAGDAQAQFDLARKHKDPIQSRHWMTLAAAKNHPAAQYQMALLHLKDHQPKQALPILERLGSLDFIPAMQTLAQQGETLQLPPPLREFWMRRGVERQDPISMQHLAQHLDQPKASQKAHQEAQSWRKKAYRLCLRSTPLETYLPWGTAPTPTPPSNLTPAERILILTPHAETDVDAMMALAILYENTQPKVSLAWWQRAAQAGDAIAQSRYGHALAIGLWDTSPNVEEGLKWIFLAVAQGSPEAEMNAAYAYQKAASLISPTSEPDAQRAIERIKQLRQQSNDWKQKAQQHGCLED